MKAMVVNSISGPPWTLRKCDGLQWLKMRRRTRTCSSKKTNVRGETGFFLCPFQALRKGYLLNENSYEN
jgi:hypothetical protein